MFWRWGRRVARFVGLPGPGRGLGARDLPRCPGTAGWVRPRGAPGRAWRTGIRCAGTAQPAPRPFPGHHEVTEGELSGPRGTRVCSAWFPPWRSSSTGKGNVVAVYRRQRKAAPLSSAAEEVAVEDARVISSETQRTLCFALRFLSTPSHGEGCAVSELPGGGAQDRGLGEGACMYYL